MLRRITTLATVAATITAHAQTIGLQTYGPGNVDGYVLFAPTPNTTTYLIDKCGRSVHTWNSAYKPGQAVYLLDDGSLLRTGNANNTTFNSGGKGGAVELIAWDGTILWSYVISDAQQCAHHDIHPMPNGHVLVIVWERHTVAEAIAQGRDPALLGSSLWSEKVLELEPVGADQANIVWEWHLWDHLVQHYDVTKPNYAVPADHPELVDLNFTTGNAPVDWIHANAIDYNEELDQVLLSSHNLNEVWVIDHSATTVEAASHAGGTQGQGGDLLYRWGNPQVYDRGTVADQQLFGQHNAQWIRAGVPHAGHILVFNNGLGRPGEPYSSVDIIDPPVQIDGSYVLASPEPFGPIDLEYTWTAPTPADFFATNISGAQPLMNGGFLICDGPAGSFFELDTNGEEIWRYVSPVDANGPMTQGDPAEGNMVFRCTLITPDHPGLTGQDLTPGAPIELQPITGPCDALGLQGSTAPSHLSAFPDPTEGAVQLELGNGSYMITIRDVWGRVVLVQRSVGSNGLALLDLSALADGTYGIFAQNGDRQFYGHVVVAH